MVLHDDGDTKLVGHTFSSFWRPATATGVGSMPGTSSLEAARIVAGELPEFLHVAELPIRGPGADMIGRTGGLLARVERSLSLETTPLGWRVAGGLGRDARRAQSFLGEDLDAFEESAIDYAGPVKTQLVGPWTLAAAVELPGGERILRDPGAVRDIAEALAEATILHVDDLRRRFPKASAFVVQFDEPSLPAVLEGRIGTSSGLSSYRAVGTQDGERVLRMVLGAGAADDVFTGVHCCAQDPPVDLLCGAGVDFVGVDLTFAQDSALDDALGSALDSGIALLAGCVPATDVDRLTEAQASAPLRDLLHRVGLDDHRWLDLVSVTPTCGLAGASPQWARSALAACRAVGRIVREDEDDNHEAGA